MAMLMVECNVSYEAMGSASAAARIVLQAQAITSADGRIVWLRSWAANNKVYSLFEADTADILRRTALKTGFKFHRLLVVDEISQAH